MPGPGIQNPLQQGPAGSAELYSVREGVGGVGGLSARFSGAEFLGAPECQPVAKALSRRRIDIGWNRPSVARRARNRFRRSTGRRSPIALNARLSRLRKPRVISVGRRDPRRIAGHWFAVERARTYVGSFAHAGVIEHGWLVSRRNVTCSWVRCCVIRRGHDVAGTYISRWHDVAGWHIRRWHDVTGWQIGRWQEVAGWEISSRVTGDYSSFHQPEPSEQSSPNCIASREIGFWRRVTGSAM